MTLPTLTLLPSTANIKITSFTDAETQIRKLVVSLHKLIGEHTTEINGTLATNFNNENAWLPEIVADEGVFQYTKQVGWAVKSGFLISCFLDIGWSSTTDTNLPIAIELPFEVSDTEGAPFCTPLLSTGLSSHPVYIECVKKGFVGNILNNSNTGSQPVTSEATNGSIFGTFQYISETT